ncbi:MAG TPA: RNA polymerase sigma factor region1.1 domain-containing protein, partial [Rubrivivax sp.]|nr:RNA polymerase sigma factor region1.1 domain-containing protein [Rubrivivax sp.]
MTAKKPAAPSKASPVTRAKGKPMAVPPLAHKKAAAAPVPAEKAKPTARTVALVKTLPKPNARSVAKTPVAAPPQAKGKRGAKAAPEPLKMMPEMPADEDFADLEADAEVAAATDAEAKAKAKPLRMKVSRAKERALMREFGLEEATLTEEEVAKRRNELKTLIKMGKTRGFLTHQEINDHLPEKLINEEILEAIISMLNDMGIAVYEQAPDAATLLVAGGGATTATEEEAEEAAEAALSTVDSEFGRTTDPVRMYMREMGTVELLTREGEI